jgi:hypothetical protein
MAIPSALYYPHANITDEALIRNSLLLWDQVEYITPFGKNSHERFESKHYNEAIDILTVPRLPTDSEKEEVHSRIVEQLQKGLPKSFFLDSNESVESQMMYSIYPGKLAHKTWQLLETHYLAKYGADELEYELNYLLGLMVMAILADVCAGESKRKITDRADAYSFLQKFTTLEAGGNYVKGCDVSQVGAEYGRLVTLSLKVLDTDDIPVSDLIEMRKREAKSSTKDYRKFRLNYLSKLDEYVDKIVKPGMRESDIKEYERQFEKDMEGDLSDLKSELRIIGKKSLLSKEVFVAAAAIPGALSTPIVGLTDVAQILGTIGVGALVKAGIEYKEARKKALRANTMSWLYLAENRSSRFDPRKVIF